MEITLVSRVLQTEIGSGMLPVIWTWPAVQLWSERWAAGFLEIKLTGESGLESLRHWWRGWDSWIRPWENRLLMRHGARCKMPASVDHTLPKLHPSVIFKCTALGTPKKADWMKFFNTSLVFHHIELPLKCVRIMNRLRTEQSILQEKKHQRWPFKGGVRWSRSNSAF